jgi:hypothetical protein
MLVFFVPFKHVHIIKVHKDRLHRNAKNTSLPRTSSTFDMLVYRNVSYLKNEPTNSRSNKAHLDTPLLLFLYILR